MWVQASTDVKFTLECHLFSSSYTLLVAQNCLILPKIARPQPLLRSSYNLSSFYFIQKLEIVFWFEFLLQFMVNTVYIFSSVSQMSSLCLYLAACWSGRLLCGGGDESSNAEESQLDFMSRETPAQIHINNKPLGAHAIQRYMTRCLI